MATILWIVGSIPLILLGSIHLYYTFFTRKLFPKENSTKELLEKSKLVLTPKTSIWKAWVGFNASHSTGVVYFGGVNLYLALTNFHCVPHPLFDTLNVLVAVFYCCLACKYWFSIPIAGTLISVMCFLTATILSLS